MFGRSTYHDFGGGDLDTHSHIYGGCYLDGWDARFKRRLGVIMECLPAISTRDGPIELSLAFRASSCQSSTLYFLVISMEKWSYLNVNSSSCHSRRNARPSKYGMLPTCLATSPKKKLWPHLSKSFKRTCANCATCGPSCHQLCRLSLELGHEGSQGG